ncbi:MAG: AAA family ATPase [Elusimicrobia bacterium]|nr:AAA family ATPase [Elusimicrobiota bacterium]
MKRDIYQKLLEWKNSRHRKPLILQGARQVGKTYILREFGRNEYSTTAYFNFEKDTGLRDFFKEKISPEKIIEKLSIYQERDILPEKTLIIFDEVQNSPETLTSLKYFQEDAKQYHIVAAGSLLGIKMGRPTTFPVGKVNLMNLYPFSFAEYLQGIGKTKLRDLLTNIKSLIPIEDIFHSELIENLKMYYFIGGMPEAILRYTQTKNLDEVRNIQTEILATYIMDISKHTTKTESMKITRAWNSMPGQLAKINKKFKFSEISKNARSRDYTESIQWLIDAGLVYKCHNIKTAKLPLSGYCEETTFKLYFLDIGLLGAMLGLSQKTIVDGNRLFSEYNGAFTENYAAQELVVNNHKELYYWSSGNMAEVDFIIVNNEQIFPLEVKAGLNTKNKSLKVFGEKYKMPLLSRATMRNFVHDGKICNYPLYAISLFPSIQ